jgi:hypothetical protein
MVYVYAIWPYYTSLRGIEKDTNIHKPGWCCAQSRERRTRMRPRPRAPRACSSRWCWSGACFTSRLFVPVGMLAAKLTARLRRTPVGSKLSPVWVANELSPSLPPLRKQIDTKRYRGGEAAVVFVVWYNRQAHRAQ